MALTTFVAGNVLTAAQLNESFAAVGGARAVVPTSVTVTGGGSSGSVGTNGKVTFGTAATVSINGCFSADFTNYLWVCDFDISAAQAAIYLRLRASGTDNTTASSYVTQRIFGNGTSVTGARTTSNLFDSGTVAASASTNGAAGMFYRPFDADTTAMNVIWSSAEVGSIYSHVIGTHNQGTSYDGFTIYPASGSMSGTITVYGLFG